jgi:TolB-like protein/DNA-binding winged helix-turn-helix (wHTH) protein/Tfp pilus assembly protein PilF
MKSFQAFRLDTANQCLWRGQERVSIPPKPYDMLRYLVENPGRLVTQDELLEKLWPETYVNPELIRKYILDIRKVLGDRPDKPEFIETVTKRGYRFIALVTDESAAESDSRETEGKITKERAGPDTPRSELKSGSGKRILLKVAIMAALAVAATIVIGGQLRSSRKGANAPSLSNTSIAVLPFADLSPGKDQEYFSDGLSEQLINDLAKVSGLKVAGRSSAFQFRGKSEDLREVGRKLGVSNILEGSVCRKGNHVRITAELVKADDGFQLWSQKYDREIDDIFTVQDEIARAATVAMQVKLLGNNGQPVASSLRSPDPESYQAYLQGQYFAARGLDKGDLQKALGFADNAILLDPKYAPAWAQRARVLECLASLALIDNTRGFRDARESAEKAIALDPGLASAYLTLGMIQVDHDWDWDGADVSLKKAEMLEPGGAEVFDDRAYLARTLGRIDDAIELFRQAVALDPLRGDFYLALGYELYFASRFDEARNALQRAKELNPEISSLHLTLGKILLAEGHADQALAEMELETGEWEKFSGEALAYHALGRRQDSDAALGKLITTHHSDCAYQIAETYAYRAEIDKAFTWLDRAYRQRDSGLPELKTNPLMTSLRKDPRYPKLLSKIRLPI